jgi:hypothetical protein
MAESVDEKRRQTREQREQEVYENDQLRLYQQMQQEREDDIKEKKAAVEAEREAIFAKLSVEEQARRSKIEYEERLRNELYQEEYEEDQRRKEYNE